MRWLQNQVEKFCRKYPRFGIPNLMLYIALANVVIGILDTFSVYPISAFLYFDRAAIFQGQFWRLVTFVFLPLNSNLILIVLSACFYYWVGSILEREWGTARFTLFYLMGVILNILFGLVAGFASMYYVNLSLFFAFAVLFPNMEILLMMVLPFKVKWLAWIDAALFAWGIVNILLTGNIVGALLPLVAIFNFFLFFWENFMDALGYRKRRFAHQHSKQTIQFKKAVKSAYERKGYIHKCAVCGITDTEAPNTEFRYCSKCTGGTYCYCSEHIHNHEHIV